MSDEQLDTSEQGNQNIPNYTPLELDPLMQVANEKTTVWWEHSASLSFFMKYQKFFILVFMTSFGILLLGGLVISHIKAEHGLMVFASDPQLWRAGRPVSVRIEARTLLFAQNIYLEEVEIRWIDGQGVIHQKDKLTTHIGPFIQGNILTPVRSGEWTMQVYAPGLSPVRYHGARIGTDDGFDQLKRSGKPVELIAQAQVQLRDPQQTEAWVWPGQSSIADTAQAREGNGLLSVFASQGDLPFELSSDMFVIVQDDVGAPWEGKVDFELTHGKSAMKTSHVMYTNAWGIATWRVLAQSPSLTWKHEVMINDELNVSYKRVWPKARQVSLQSHQRLIKANTNLQVEIQSSTVKPIVYVDLWHQGVWIHTQAIRLDHKTSSMTVKIPKIQAIHQLDKEPSLYWLQAYTTPYMPGEHKSGQYLLAKKYDHLHSANDSSNIDVTLDQNTTGQWLKDLMIQHKVSPSSYWSQLQAEDFLEPSVLAVALSRIKTGDTDPKLIINSTHSAQESMQLLKAKYQKSFMILMASFCAILCLMMGWMMWVHHQNLKQNQLNQLVYQSSKKLLWTWFIPVALILILFFTGLISLVFLMKW